VDGLADLHARLRTVDGVRVWANAPMAPFTTIGTGGKAGLLVTVSTSEALATVLAALEESGQDWFSLGAGSNLLVADRGYKGVVVKLDDDFQYVAGLPVAPAKGAAPAEGAPPAECHPVELTVGAAAFLARLAAVVAEAGLSGMEHACGIPGSVGGAVAMNAGAYGWCMRDTLRGIQVVSAEGVRWIAPEDLEWGYRHCGLPPRTIVTAVRISLMPSDCDAVMQCQRGYLKQRREKQPRSVRTFGSTFKNPPGHHAGRMVEAAGLKGMRHGGAEISTVHGNFLVNLGDATTGDVLALMGLMRQGVERVSGIVLEPEVRLLGASFPWDSDGDRATDRPAAHG
jgi:UDP-N-acetylmuramate dehydrogenase